MPPCLAHGIPHDTASRPRINPCAALDQDLELAEQIQRGMATDINRAFRFGRVGSALSEWHARLAAPFAIR
ncbi:MAG: hypothetical protein KC620_09375 [Myxococcales bacterium]|nr:hypothetical protein [Myxococcales bacterium]